MDSFGQNLLMRLNRELRAFDPADFHLVVRYDEVRGSVDSFLQCRRSHDVWMPCGGIAVHFDEGELVHTEWSFKFDVEDIQRLGQRNGFLAEEYVADDSHGYALHLLLREPHLPDLQDPV